MGPLAGLRVLEIGDLGEVAGKLLADAGADVVKVEPPSGAKSRHTGPYAGDRFDLDRSIHYACWNTNKRGVTLDVASPEAGAVLRQLIERSDIVIDSTRDELWLCDCNYETFEAQAGLIWCSLSPFGRDGPWSDFEVTDLVSVALGGPMMSTGYDDHDLPPIRAEGGHSLAMGGEYAAAGILTALWQREATGTGQYIDVSIHEAVSGTTEGAFPNWEYFQRISLRQTGRHANATVPTLEWQLQCADGNYVCLMGGGMPRDERVWGALMAWMDETGANAEIRDLYGSSRGTEDRDKILAAIHAFVKSMPAEEAYRRGPGLPPALGLRAPAGAEPGRPPLARARLLRRRRLPRPRPQGDVPGRALQVQRHAPRVPPPRPPPGRAQLRALRQGAGLLGGGGAGHGPARGDLSRPEGRLQGRAGQGEAAALSFRRKEESRARALCATRATSRLATAALPGIPPSSE